MVTEFNDKSPIYLQIMDIIKMDIVIGKLKSNDKLPSVREMATNLNVNPNTLQRSYQELERLGIVYTQRGTGTFVVESENMVDDLKREMAKEVIDSFILRMRNLGFNDNEIIKSVSEETMEVK
ncbi:GntR family transcriptional regulator [Clostridium estertheticum]|uniref:GntR family transcriptional regulator n=1 Tax=Clostridium estertheticum subsp. estertheticum TaxID=1552 RepID=A0A1J0GJG7_9CLOT|nr:GntR family transcriptional regulator [Clostridium estertheticum]APC41508.1 GntR family transcriptional regulator [Clostridium estertheticum subsp. estertheticum]MBU3072778.1 GntR family transcriptional regulator [Clostridium estertheticum]MBU3163185.1 GntR family transcriptional regulator [Clostridium estertheticum]MBX4258748.1 GntR family transcriptional regulator [Clostridium estertheticum]MBX4265780.1 GntR family transcriptional regulator [Clostridium estertheticum]